MSYGSIRHRSLLMAMGEISIVNNAVATVITTTDTDTRFDETTTLSSIVQNFDSPQAGRLRYTGAITKMFHVGCTISLASSGANDTFRTILYKNGTVNANKEFTGGTALTAGTVENQAIAVGLVESTAIHVFVELATNDYLEIAIQNMTDADDLTVKHVNLFAMEMIG